jgi:phosphoglycerate kinase
MGYYYYEKIKPHKLINLGSQLRSPTLLRVDMNLPARNGKIAEDALRMRVYAHAIELYSEYSGIVVMTHQGRKGGDDFTSLKPHWRLLLNMISNDVDIDFIQYDTIFSRETEDKIRRLKRKEIILLDNVRYFDFEKNFDESCRYLEFFKGLIRTCVNDSIPTWHRKDSSLMCLPYVAPTCIGMRSSYELKILEGVLNTKDSKALICGGAKLQKISDLVKIGGTTKLYLGGLPAQLYLITQGYDLGEQNNGFLKKKFTLEEFEDAKKLEKLGVRHPIDFTVSENGEKKNVTLDEMKKSRGLIMDIGDATVEKYAESLQEKEIRIRAGPLGVTEEGYDNGVELTRMILGEGLIFLGGDTSQEVVRRGLLGHIEDTGGKVCISGGSFLHGMAGNSYPSIDLIIHMDKKQGDAELTG